MGQCPESNEREFSLPLLCFSVSLTHSHVSMYMCASTHTQAHMNITRHRSNGGKVPVHFTQVWAGPLDIQIFFSLSFYELKMKPNSYSIFLPPSVVYSLCELPYNCLDLDIWGQKTTISNLFTV